MARGMLGLIGAARDVRWLAVRNDAGEEIPAHGIIKITGADVRTGAVILIGEKPDAYGSQYTHYVNGPTPIPDGKWGQCCHPDNAYALYDTSDGTPAFEELWGPVDGEWKLKKDSGGFMILGDHDAEAGLVRVVQAPMLTVLVEADAAVTKGSTGTVSVLKGGTRGSEDDTGINLTTVLARFGDVESGLQYRVRWTPDGWEYEVGECD